MPICSSPLPSGEGVIWCSGLSAALTLDLSFVSARCLLPTNRRARDVLCSNPANILPGQAKITLLYPLSGERGSFCSMYGHSFLVSCLQAPLHLVYYEPENVVATHCALIDAAALMRRCVLTRLAMPRLAVPIAPKIQAQNLYESVSWLLLASNYKHIVLLVPTCIFAVLL